MPPNLTSRAIFRVGVLILSIGIATSLLSFQIASGLTAPDGLAFAVVSTITGLVSQITLIVGGVMIGSSPLARLMENPPQRPDASTILMRDTLDKRRHHKRP